MGLPFSYCMTDFEADWEDDADFFNYRHRRRLSDPSANLNNFNRYAFRSMAPSSDTAGGKARSENEGLDNLINELYEVEAGDLRDGTLSRCIANGCGYCYFLGTGWHLDDSI